MRQAHSVVSRLAPRKYFRHWTTAGLDLLFPPQCAGCSAPGRRICARCAQQVVPAPALVCARCGRRRPADARLCARCADSPHGDLHQVRAASLHVEPLRTFIHRLKYEDHPDLAAPLARYLAAAFAAPDWDDIRDQIDTVAPVPMHAARRKERGYNQAELLAAEFCSRTGLLLDTRLLRREKFTRAQVGLNAAERHANVADAFVATTTCAGRHMLLIDDVYTTGATLQACAAAALAAGAHLVCGLTLAMPAQ